MRVAAMTQTAIRPTRRRISRSCAPDGVPLDLGVESGRRIGLRHSGTLLLRPRDGTGGGGQQHRNPGKQPSFRGSTARGPWESPSRLAYQEIVGLDSKSDAGQ